MNQDFHFLIYNTPDNDVRINAVIKDDTIWLTQKAMGVLFDTSTDNISLHLKNIYNDGELLENATAENFSVVQKEGNREVQRNLNFYNLDAIISVGYRVNSSKATQFRIWATNVLKEFVIKGFVLDDERLKQGKTAFGKDYFKELLERVRSIRASDLRHCATSLCHSAWSIAESQNLLVDPRAGFCDFVQNDRGIVRNIEAVR